MQTSLVPSEKGCVGSMNFRIPVSDILTLVLEMRGELTCGGGRRCVVGVQGRKAGGSCRLTVENSAFDEEEAEELG